VVVRPGVRPGEAGLTAAWWQVLGAVLGEPLPVVGIAREMGLADAVGTLRVLSAALEESFPGT
jgi:hypothetical protein